MIQLGEVVVRPSAASKCPVATRIPLRIHGEPLPEARAVEEEVRRRLGCRKLKLEAAVEGARVHAAVDCFVEERCEVYEVKLVGHPTVSKWALMEKVVQAGIYALAVEKYCAERGGGPVAAYILFFTSDGREYAVRLTVEAVRHVRELLRQTVAGSTPYKHVSCGDCQYAPVCLLRGAAGRYVDPELERISLELARRAGVPVRG